MSAKPKPATSPTLAAYHGQTSRLCAALGIVPMAGTDKLQAEFDAVAAWLQERQEQKRKQKNEMELFE